MPLSIRAHTFKDSFGTLLLLAKTLSHTLEGLLKVFCCLSVGLPMAAGWMWSSSCCNSKPTRITSRALTRRRSVCRRRAKAGTSSTCSTSTTPTRIPAEQRSRSQQKKASGCPDSNQEPIDLHYTNYSLLRYQLRHSRIYRDIPEIILPFASVCTLTKHTILFRCTPKKKQLPSLSKNLVFLFLRLCYQRKNFCSFFFFRIVFRTRCRRPKAWPTPR